jgi:cytochrome P450
MMRLTLRIVSECLFGLDLSAESADTRAAIQFIQQDANRRITAVWDVPFSWPTAHNRRLRAARATLDRILARVIVDRRPGEDRGDLLSMLIDARDADTDDRMSESQLRDELVTMFLAGHESTANALSWLFFLLSRHPEVARELTSELARELGGRAPTTADLPRLPYCQAVIKETMRLYPPAWSMGRAPIDDDVIGGFTIPRGSLVILAPWATHRHPAFWTNPEGFDPSRFLRTEPDRYAYFPFGGGPRLCIGMGFALLEAELVLATIAQRYRLDLVPGQAVEPEPQITLRPRRGVRVTAHAVEH